MHERRLMDEGASVLEREVLAAWEDEKAPHATRVRAARLAVEVAGLTVVAAGTVQGAAGLGAKGLGWGFSWLTKGLAMALFVGAAATVVTSVVSGVTGVTGEGPLAAASAPTVPPSPPPARLVRSSGSVPSAKLDPASARPPTNPMTPAPPPKAVPVNETVRSAPPREQRHDVPRGERASKPAWSVAPASSASPASPTPGVAAVPRFTDEVRMLGDVRAALTAHDPARGLLVLDTFATVYPTSVLTAEAEVLRIDAVLARGDRTLARKLATAFLAVRPKSPYRQHVEGVLEKSAAGAMR